MNKTRQQIADWSTINLDELHKLPTHELGGYHLQADAGNGCAGNPPGYPTYFTRSVYTSSGNNPPKGPQQVIAYNGINYVTEGDWSGSWEEMRAKYDALMRRLWKPLPLDHPRTQAWILATFGHHNCCYHAPGYKDWSKEMLIWPVPDFADTPFGKIEWEEFEIEQAQKYKAFDKWRPDEQEKFIASIRDNNARVMRLCEEVATPDNHDGTIIVRRYYPEFNPTPELIAAKFERPGSWWEVMATQPTPEECPGQYSMAHPCNGSWCQMCGWSGKEAA